MTLTEDECQLVCSVVKQQSGIVLDQSKGYLIETRLTSLARREGLDTPKQLLAEMRSKPRQYEAKVVEALTTNETSFFRDIHPFEGFRKFVIPDLLTSRAKDRKLSVWCAAASTGQEPYTLGMILKDQPELTNWSISFLATDLSTQVLDQAKRGTYSQLEVNRGLPAQYLVKYFTRNGMEWRINDNVRQMIQYRPMNLLEPFTGVPMMDVIFMRNVLIYFDVETKKSILAKVRKVLRPDGYFFLGGAETTMNLDDQFVRVTIGPSVCYRLKS